MIRTKRKSMILAAILVVGALSAAGYLAYSSKSTSSRPKLSNENLSNQQINEKFDCDRLTADVKETDIYCQFPDLYRNGTITDAELQTGLGCEKKSEITNQDHPCLNTQKYTEYKEFLLKEDKKLKSTGCVNACPQNNNY